MRKMFEEYGKSFQLMPVFEKEMLELQINKEIPNEIVLSRRSLRLDDEKSSQITP